MDSVGVFSILGNHGLEIPTKVFSSILFFLRLEYPMTSFCGRNNTTWPLFSLSTAREYLFSYKFEWKLTLHLFLSPPEKS